MNKIRYIIESIFPEQGVIPIVGIFVGAAIASNNIPNLNILIIPFLAFFFLALGFNGFSSIFDIKIDKINKPKRPILIGKITIKELLFISATFYIIGLILASLSSLIILILGIIFTIITLFYSIPPIRIKKRFLGSNIAAGLLYGVIPLLTGYAIVDMSKVSLPIVLFFFAVTGILSTIKDLDDYLGDKKNKIKTLPVICGPKKIGWIVSTSFLTTTFIFLLYAISKNMIKLIIATSFVTLLGIIFSIFLIKRTEKYLNFFSAKKTVYQSKGTRIALFLALFTELIYGLIYAFW